MLRKALHRLVNLIASGEVNYFYVQDQFKGLRQDCVIQAIKNDLAVEIYESHARAALEYGDVAEYNQCQGQLRMLYADGVISSEAAEAEFLAYRILYQSIHAHKGELVGLLHTLQQVGSSKYVNHSSIKHALRVRSAIASHNHALFFKLYSSAPALGRALMDLAIRRLRFEALKHFVTAFKPTLSVEFIARVLGFLSVSAMPSNAREKTGPSPGKNKTHSKGKKKTKEKKPLSGCTSSSFAGKHASKAELPEALTDCIEWLEECGATVQDSDKMVAVLDCKASMGELHIPEEKNAVAHGDANLDIGDFLKGFSSEAATR